MSYLCRECGTVIMEDDTDLCCQCRIGYESVLSSCTIQPPIKKTCPECGGSGYIEGKIIHFATGSKYPGCGKCNGTGEIYNYLTPEQWETETGEKMLDSDPVWYWGYWCDDAPEKEWLLAAYGDLYPYAKDKLFVARPGQPKPESKGE